MLLLCIGRIIALRSVNAQSLLTSALVQGTYGSKYHTTVRLYPRTEDHFRGTPCRLANM